MFVIMSVSVFATMHTHTKVTELCNCNNEHSNTPYQQSLKTHKNRFCTRFAQVGY